MVEQTKRVLKVSFNGKEMLESKIFDTTDAEIAKKNAMFDPKRKYGPLTIITGEHELLPLVEKELEQMKVGEKRTVKLATKDSFGERKNDLVRVVPLKLFHDQKMNPVPGLVITTGNAYGKVQSVSGGRVRVDFNHPLAGRNIEYEVTIEAEITDKKARAETLYEKYYLFVPGSKKEIAGEKLIVGLEKDTLKNLDKINESIKRLAKDLGVEIEFKEIAEKEIKSKKDNSEKEAEEAHLHKHAHECDDIECSHTHEHNCVCEESEQCECTDDGCKCVEETEVLPEQRETKSINKIADELKKPAKSEVKTTVTKDFSSTIQRPKKK